MNVWCACSFFPWIFALHLGNSRFEKYHGILCWWTSVCARHQNIGRPLAGHRVILLLANVHLFRGMILLIASGRAKEDPHYYFYWVPTGFRQGALHINRDVNGSLIWMRLLSWTYSICLQHYFLSGASENHIQCLYNMVYIIWISFSHCLNTFHS